MGAASRHPAVQGRRRSALYERREVRDALAYLRAEVNPDDDTVGLRRILTEPARAVCDRLARLAGTVTPTHPDYADGTPAGSALNRQNSPAGRITRPST